MFVLFNYLMFTKYVRGPQAAHVPRKENLWPIALTVEFIIAYQIDIITT